jgi:hypothetical protein
MSWHGRNRNRKQNVRDYSKKEVEAAVDAKLHNRWMALAPDPVKAMELYDCLYTPQQHEAIGVLSHFPDLLSEGQQFHLHFGGLDANYQFPMGPEGPWKMRVERLKVSMPVSRPLPSTHAAYGKFFAKHVSELPEHLMIPLLDWVPRWLQLKAETVAVSSKVESLFECCNTMGQIKRVWPNIVSFLPDRAQEILRNAKVQSPYPDDVMGYDESRDLEGQTRQLKPEWSPKYLAWHDRVLTEALLMPDHADDDFMLNVEFTKL